MREAAFPIVAAVKISALTGSDPRANLRITSQSLEWQAASASASSAPCSPGEQQYVGPLLKAFPHTHTVLSQDDRAAKQKRAVFFANNTETAKQEGLWGWGGEPGGPRCLVIVPLSPAPLMLVRLDHNVGPDASPPTEDFCSRLKEKEIFFPFAQKLEFDNVLELSCILLEEFKKILIFFFYFPLLNRTHPFCIIPYDFMKYEVTMILSCGLHSIGTANNSKLFKFFRI